MAPVSINKPFSNIVWFDCFNSNDIKTLNIAIKHELGISGVLEEKTNHAQMVESDQEKSGIFFKVPFTDSLMQLLSIWMGVCMKKNMDYFGFDIDWHWPILSFNYNVYGVGDGYGWHSDVSSAFGTDTKLTFILDLSEKEYEGGEFQLLGQPENHFVDTFNPGTTIAFPSPLAHRVTPVTKGERITMSFWAQGTPWR